MPGCMSAVASTSGICAGVHVPTAPAGVEASVVARTTTDAIAPTQNGRLSARGTERNIGLPLLVARGHALRHLEGSRGSTDHEKPAESPGGSLRHPFGFGKDRSGAEPVDRLPGLPD